MKLVMGLGAIRATTILGAAIGSALLNRSASSIEIESPPTISSIMPSNPSEWSTVTLYGSNFQSSDSDCSLSFSGEPAYVIDCSDTEILAVTPWVSGEMTAVVHSSEGESAGLLISLAPRDVAGLPELVEGRVAIHSSITGKAPLLTNLGMSDDLVSSLASASPVLSDWYSVEVPAGEEFSRSRQLMNLPGIDYAGPVTTPVSGDVPNDEYFSEQWYLSHIEASEAWDISKGDSIRVAVIDTGFQTNHADLATHILPGLNCHGTSEVTPLFGSWHGTAVAALAAGVTNNTYGIAGVGWNSSIIPYRLDTLRLPEEPPATCPQLPGADAAYLVDQAVSAGADVINMSFTYGGPTPYICESLANAWKQDVVTVASMGNNGSQTNLMPSSCFNTLGVAATGHDGASRASYSNYGPKTDISAPGGEGDGTLSCLSSDSSKLMRIATYDPNFSTWTHGCGTSFAAPLVSGTAALLAKSGYFPCEISETLRGVTLAYPNGGNPALVDPINFQGGGGRLNAGEALGWSTLLPSQIITRTYWPTGSVFHGEVGSQRYILINDAKYPGTVSGESERGDQCIAQDLVDCFPTGPSFPDDPDLDGMANPCDNCPNWANPQQNLPNWQLPPSGDPDCDGYPNTVPNGPGAVGARAGETTIGTVATKQCAASSTINNEPLPDAWPPDFNDSKSVTGQDFLVFNFLLGQPVSNPPVLIPGVGLTEVRRADLNGSGSVTGADFLQFNDFMGKVCS